ncbi:MAG: hypothetical protein P8J79_11520 [Halioglobus sp.]|nr:hypothetical protein [Halioglobus sp.]
MSGGADYNDNEGLSREDKRSTSGVQLSLPINFMMRSERTSASFKSELKSFKFDDSGYNSNDQNFQADTSHQLERGYVSGSAGYMRGSTRTTEFLDTGRIGGVSTRVERVSAATSAAYYLTENNRASAGLTYGKTDYASPRYIGGTTIAASIGAANQWSDRTSLSLRARVARYQNDANRQTTSDIIGSQAGFNSVLSENLDMSLSGGLTYVKTSIDSNASASRPDSNTTGYVVNGAVNYRQERYSLSATLARNIRPTGNGDLNIFDQVTVDYRYKLSDLSAFNVRLIGGNTEALEGSLDNDRTFALIRLGITYKLSQYWAASGGYTYRYQDAGRGAAQSNALQINLTFNPETYMWSR